MQILMTGATGFVGSHVLEGLIKDGHSVCILKRSFSSIERIKDVIDQCIVYNQDEMSIAQIYEKQPIDCVVHCATHYGRNDRECMKNVETNLMFPLELLSVGCEKGIRYFINTDSFFGNQIAREQDLDRELYMYGYTLSKTQFRQWGHMFAAKFGIKFINMKLEHVYGEKDDENKFIPYILNACLQNKPLIALSNGTQLRDFVHISDVVNAYRIVITNLESYIEEAYTEYGVGTGKMRSVREFVEMVHESVGSTSILDWGAIPMKIGEMMQSKADNSRLYNLGWIPKIVEKKDIEYIFSAKGKYGIQAEE